MVSASQATTTFNFFASSLIVSSSFNAALNHFRTGLMKAAAPPVGKR
jgi:hypothetical protein